MSELRDHVEICSELQLPDLDLNRDAALPTEDTDTRTVSILDDNSILETIEEEAIQLNHPQLIVREEHQRPSGTEEININDSNDLFEEIIQYCTDNNIDEPTDILHVLQIRIVTGRALKIENEAEAMSEGDTNYIIVSRDNILEEGLEELKNIQNPRLTLEVQFTGEVNSFN